MKSGSFLRVEFGDYCNFSSVEFQEGASFHQTSFASNAVFSLAKFKKATRFSEVIFSDDAYFGSAQIEQRIFFEYAQFHGEINFQNAKIGLLKYFDASKASFEGVVLESAQFWGFDTLENYYFKDAMLLGLSLAGKKLVNCDFTGAVFAGCHIRAEDFDEATCRNTKYIYTEYEIGDSGAEDFPTPKGFGNIREVEDENPKPKYSPKASSRVPAEGNFGDEGNPVSVAAYFHEPYKWNYALPLPREVRTSFMNYLHFFADYAKATQDLQVQLSQYPEGKKVRLVLQIEDAALRPMVEATLGEYLANLTKPFPEVEVAFRDHEMSDFDKAVFLADYQNTLATTQANLALRYKTLGEAKRKEMEMSFGIMTPDQIVIHRLIDLSENIAKTKSLPEHVTIGGATVHVENKTQIAISIVHETRQNRNELASELGNLIRALKYAKEETEIVDAELAEEIDEAIQKLERDKDIDEANTPEVVEEKVGRLKTWMQKTKKIYDKAKEKADKVSDKIPDKLEKIGKAYTVAKPIIDALWNATMK
jgi:metal-responsive CopG/Arc/MetJ family transcriptional regulator